MRMPPSGDVSDVLQRQMRDVDEPRRLLDVALHQIEQVGAAGEAARVAVGERLDGGVDGSGLHVVEGAHRHALVDASRTAATMPT